MMETYSEEDAFAKRANNYIGQKLKYFDPVSGDDKEGVLEKVEFHSRLKISVAYFQRVNVTSNVLPAPRNVPLRLVSLPTGVTSSDTNWMYLKMSKSNTRPTSSTDSSQILPRKTFEFFHKIYNVTDGNYFKPGEEVVWGKHSTNDKPCVGKIVVTAEREDGVNAFNYKNVAIVQFKSQPMPRAGFKVTGYFPNYLPGAKNTYVVPLKELLTQLEWGSCRETGKPHELGVVGIGNQKKGNATPAKAPKNELPTQKMLKNSTDKPKQGPKINPKVGGRGMGVSEKMNPVAKLPIKVCTMDGKTYKINATKDWNVRMLKIEFEKWHGGDATKCSLYYRVKKLQDSNTLKDYNIGADEVIMANFRSTGGKLYT